MLEGVSREAGPFEFVVCADGARVGLGLRARASGCARGPVAGRVGLGLCARASGRRGARAWDCARVPRTVRVGPFTGSGNPFLRSWALLVAVWAACLGYHLWG